MPLEIKELKIKVTVGDEPKTGTQRGGAGTGGAPQRQLVQQAVEEVLRILEQKRQR